MNKIAIDNAAKAYWRLLYGEYGEQLVRDIPRRVKAALLANKRLASTEGDGLIFPTAHVVSDGSLKVEGMYRDASVKLMFLATLDKDCNVTEIKSFDLR